MITLVSLLILMVQQTMAVCSADCTDCSTRATCVGSLETDGCAWSGTSCISSVDTPFIIFVNPVTGNNAVTVCSSNGYELASIRNQEEYELAASYCESKAHGGDGDCWIGLRYTSGPEYEWSDGTTFTYGAYDTANSDYPTPPWEPSSQGNNPQTCGVGLSGNNCCVYYDFDEDDTVDGWDDTSCDSTTRQEPTLCRRTNATTTTTAPTPAPTNNYSDDDDDSSEDIDSSDENLLFKAMDKSENIEDAAASVHTEKIEIVLDTQINVVYLILFSFGFILLIAGGYLFCKFCGINRNATPKSTINHEIV